MMVTKSLLAQVLLGQQRVIEGKSAQHISKEPPHPGCQWKCRNAALARMHQEGLGLTFAGTNLTQCGLGDVKAARQ